MLDIMRRKKRLRAVLWLVILSLALGMLLFFVPGQTPSISGLESYAASVDGDEISLREFINTYRRAVDNFSGRGSNRIDPEMLKKLGLDRQAIDALINARVVRHAAKKLGLEVSPEEIRRAVESHPNLQDGGVFIGVERYKALLAANNINVSEFETSMEYSLLEKKLRSIISDSMEIPEQDIRDEFQRANQQARASFVTLRKGDFLKRPAPSEEALRAYFEENKDNYRVKEQRRAQYLLLSLSDIASTIEVSESELRERWSRESPEESVDASHILLTVEDPAQEAAVRAKADSILKRAKSGEDFAKLAETFSQDPGSAAQGGNLGSFPRGRMVKEFEDAAFSLKPGELSDLVRTQFGFHIIKVNRHDIPTFESRREGLKRTIQLDKASEILKEKSLEAEKLAKDQKDLTELLKVLKVPGKVEETGFFSKDSDPFSIGISQALRDEVFRLKEIGEIGSSAEHPAGQAIPKLLETQLPKPPDFSESRDAVLKDFIEVKSREEMQAAARKLAEEATKLGGLEKASQKAGLRVKETESFKRSDSPDPDIGLSPAFSAAAFELPVGGVSTPIPIEGGERLVVLQVKSRTPFDEAEYQKQRAEILQRVEGAWKDAFFQEYIRNITQNLEKAGKIRINQKVLDQVTGVRS